MTEVDVSNENGINRVSISHPIPTEAPVEKEVVAVPMKKKLAHTNYFLTIATNERFNDFQEQAYIQSAQQLHDAYNQIMSIENFINYVKMPAGQTFASPFIKEVYDDMAIELSPSKGHLHLHAIIMISHYSTIQIDFQRMKRDISDLIYGPGDPRTVYMFRKWFGSAKETLESYISKNQTELHSKGVIG